MTRIADNPVAVLLILFLVVGVLGLGLFIAALVSILGKHSLSSDRKALWVLVVFLLPVVGSIVWFAVGRKGATEPGPQSGTVAPPSDRGTEEFRGA